MTYSISQVAARFHIEPHTLRFYEKEGIIEPCRSKSGIRTYTEQNISQLEMAMCLKSTGMPLKEIKRYFDLVVLGDCTLDERLTLFQDHQVRVLEDMAAIQRNLEKIEGKIKWYTRYIKERKAQLELEGEEMPLAK